MRQDPLEEHPLEVAGLPKTVNENYQALLNIMNNIGDGPLAEPFINPKA